MGNFTPTYKYDNTKNIYRQLLVSLLKDYKVKKIVNFGEEEPFFEKIEMDKNGDLSVWRAGYKFNNFHFDHTCDFARCISYIEDAIYLTIRNSTNRKGRHGYVVKFYE